MKSFTAESGVEAITEIPISVWEHDLAEIFGREPRAAARPQQESRALILGQPAMDQRTLGRELAMPELIDHWLCLSQDIWMHRCAICGPSQAGGGFVPTNQPITHHHNCPVVRFRDLRESRPEAA